MEKPTGVINENLNNFDEDDSGISRYLLDESLKDAWYRICNAQNRSTRKQSTSVLLRNFYVGITPCNRYILDTITGGNFLGRHSFDSYNAMLDLFGPPPLLVNGTILTLEHVMIRL